MGGTLWETLHLHLEERYLPPASVAKVKKWMGLGNGIMGKEGGLQENLSLDP